MLSPQTVAKTKKVIHFEFAQNTVSEPVLYNLTRRFDVVINVRGASVTEDGGFLDLEIEGEEVELEQAIEAMRAWGSVDPNP